jgi:hypothetical protein
MTRGSFTSCNCPDLRTGVISLGITVWLFAGIVGADAQGSLVSTNAPGVSNVVKSSVQPPPTADSAAAAFEREEKLRIACVEGRRLICGKILDVLPEGLVVESGYTNLLREPIKKSWLLPGTVEASRATNLIEEKAPGAVCVGLTLVVNAPKGKARKPEKFDYVIIEGYPAGEFNYTSAGTVRRTIRRFSANLAGALKLNAEAQKKSEPR